MTWSLISINIFFAWNIYQNESMEIRLEKWTVEKRFLEERKTTQSFKN